MRSDFSRQSVLDSAGGNQDQAIETLLGMSDPDYVPQQPQNLPVESCSFNLLEPALRSDDALSLVPV